MPTTEFPKEEEVVISGISGRFPESDSVIEFWEKLLNEEDLVTEDERRWDMGTRGAPPHSGKLKDISLFDADFFGIPHAQTEIIDPQSRILIELCYEAIFDAGVNPVSLRGTNTGVFVACSTNDVTVLWGRKKPEAFENLALFGCAISLLSNRISYAFDFTGPSITVDSACAGSLYAIDIAMQSLNRGECDSAIVAGTNLLLNPIISGIFHSLKMTSPDGRCRSFDNSANGFVRSEGVVVIFLQNANAARRVYGSIVNIGTNADGYKPRGLSFPSRILQARLFKKVASEAKISLDSLAYLELHGTGTRVGDPEELSAVEEVYCNGRSTPLYIGSVKSNMGHAEGASGLCSLVKVLLSMKFGEIPPNLHYKTPNARVPALVGGRMKVVTTRLPLQGDLVGINSFGFGGSNGHLIVRRPKQNHEIKVNESMLFPVIVGVSGRTQDAVDVLLNQVEDQPTSDGLIALLHEIHSINTPGHLYRGHVIILEDGTKQRNLQKQLETQRPVWFIFPGLGGLWPTMGQDLLKIPVFYSAIQSCNNALTPFNLNIFDIFSDTSNGIIKNLKKAFVGIVAIQIGLFDILDSLGIKPDGIIGHSLGEIPSGYADGCLTREEAILAAYYRAEVVLTKECSGGAMISVNLPAEVAMTMVSRDIVLACDNGPNNVILSGKESAAEELMSSLHEQGISSTRLKTSNIAFHSKCIRSAVPKLLEKLKEIIPKPKCRSNKWISSSIQKSEWGSDLAQMCSPEYFVHNLSSPVKFRDASMEIPSNAIVIEIGPHGILQVPLYDALPSTTTLLSLLTKHQPCVKSLVISLGRLYNCGLQPKFSSLYPPVQFPVKNNTPVLSSLISWNHEKKWSVPRFKDSEQRYLNNISIDISRVEDSWYKGHQLDGRVIMPATGYLVLVMKTLAASLNLTYDQVPILFQDVQFHRPTVLHDYRTIELSVDLLLVCGKFEVTEKGHTVVSGTISVAESPNEETGFATSSNKSQHDPNSPMLHKTDVYKELCLKGYQYSGEFQGVLEFCGNEGSVQATTNLVTLLDSLLQVALLAKSTSKRELCVPTKIGRVLIDPQKLFTQRDNTGDKIKVSLNKYLATINCLGVHISGIKHSVLQHSLPTVQPLIEYVSYVPYHGFTTSSLDETIQISMQIILENAKSSFRYNEKIKIADFTRDQEITKKVSMMIEKLPTVDAEVIFIDEGSQDVKDLKDCSIVMSTEANNCNIVLTKQIKPQVVNAVNEGDFLLLLANSEPSNNCVKILASFQIPDTGCLYLLKKNSFVQTKKDYRVIHFENEESFHWLEELKTSLKSFEGDVLVLVEPKTPVSGIIGLVNCLRYEKNGFKLRCMYIQDSQAPPFSLTDVFYSSQLSLGLVMNIYKDGQWCTLRHLELSSKIPSTILVNYAYVNTTCGGALSSLKWLQGSDLKSPSDGGTLCHVYCSAVNFHDIMAASGKLPSNAEAANLAVEDCKIGSEFSGRDLSGNRVMGLVFCKGIASLARARFILEVPEHWSLEEAATVPVAYSTAYYSLIIRGNLKANESVLIHAGAGGVGQAAIAIALSMGCTVFTTVGSEKKRAFLKERFHQLTDESIANSRSTSFEEHVLQKTNGRGVDVILNSLAEDKLLASVRCLAVNGRFLEIGKFDLALDHSLGLEVFLKNISFHGICLQTVLAGDGDVRDQLSSLLKQGVECGVVQPLPQHIFSHDQVQEAFRFMASGKHIGKVVIRIREEEMTSSGHCLAIQPSTKTIEALPRFHVQHDSVFIVTGGLGGFGLELSNWLVSRGARHLILTSRTGHCEGYKALCVSRWREAGVLVHISTYDMTTEQGTEDLLKEAATMGVVRGIFHLAVVLRDCMLVKQTKESFQAVCEAKMSITKNLDKVSRDLCKSLQYFVVFSSMVCGRGNPGQSNYGMANSAAERIVEMRRYSGYPALAIQWGPIADVGLAAHMKQLVLPSSVQLQSIHSCLEVLETFLLNDKYAVVGSILVSKDNQNKQSEMDSVKKMLSLLATAFGVKDLQEIPSTTPLTKLGMDSLMQVEVANHLEIHRGIKLSSREVEMLTVKRLMEIVHGVHCNNPEGVETSKITKLSNGTQLSTNENHSEYPYHGQVVNAHIENLINIHINKEYRNHVMDIYTSGNVPAMMARMNYMAIPLVPEKTMISLESVVVDDDLLSPLFIVHPLEGSCKPLEGVSKFIECPVYGLQFTSSAPRTTVHDLVAFYLKHIQTVQDKGPYYIGGYSMGAVIASEMAMLLEEAGETVHLLCLDGIVCFDFPSIGENAIMTLRNRFDQEMIVQSALQYQPTIDESKLRSTLSSLSGWPEYLKHYTSLLSATGDSMADQIENLKEKLEYLHWRYQAMMYHSAPENACIKANVVVISAQDSFMRILRGQYHGFNLVCEKEVKVFIVDGNHTSFITGTERMKEVARIINEHFICQQSR